MKTLELNGCLLALWASIAGCAAGPKAIARSEAEPLVAKGEQAIGALREALMRRLTQAMAQGGVPKAIDVCALEASHISTEVTRLQGVEVGRTSARLRNPLNAPRAWAAPTVRASSGLRAAEVETRVFDLGDRIGVLAPIPTGGLCLSCHGSKASLLPEVAAVLAARYPEDTAVDFSAGDLRGYFWAEVKKKD